MKAVEATINLKKLIDYLDKLYLKATVYLS